MLGAPLEQRIILDGYSRYARHAAWLTERGHHISEASLQRYGRHLRQIERIRVVTREATALTDSTPDDGQLAGATIRLLQGAIWHAGQKLGDDDPAVLAAIRHDLRVLGSVGRAVADLARASLAAGVSADVEAAIRQAIEGATPRVNSRIKSPHPVAPRQIAHFLSLDLVPRFSRSSSQSAWS